ncbi:MAG: flagellar biosynthesis protein FlgF [Thalassovita sp.]
MDRLVHTALNALSNQRDLRISQAQNLANMNVPGYRRDLPNEGKTYFADSMNTAMVRAFQTETGPAGFLANSGPLQPTGSELDVAVVDEGYMYIQPEEEGAEPALTRRGDMHRDVEGFLRNGAGELMLDPTMNPIELQPYKDIQISDIGDIWVMPVDAPDGAAPLLAGTLATVIPDDDLVLRKSGDGQIRAEDGSVPNPNQLAKLSQGVLEGSNVNSVEEMISSIEMQRNFELGLRMITNASKLDEASARLLRAPDG